MRCFGTVHSEDSGSFPPIYCRFVIVWNYLSVFRWFSFSFLFKKTKSFLKFYLFILESVCESVCVFMYTTCMQEPVEAKEGIKNLGTGLTGSWEPPSLGNGNWTSVLCKSNGCPSRWTSLQPFCVLQTGSPCVSLLGTCSFPASTLKCSNNCRCVPPHLAPPFKLK